MSGAPQSSELRSKEVQVITSLKRAVEQRKLGLDRAVENEFIEFIDNNTEAEKDRRLVSCRDLVKNYSGTRFYLRPVSFELNCGEILGIVGVNASGKSTLLKMLVGDLAPDGGQLSFPYFEQKDPNLHWNSVRRRIAYVEQALPTWPGKVLDNLRYVAAIYGHPRLRIDQYLSQLLQRYGLDRFANSTWTQLSGGYKTRFEIVRALLTRPDLLVLDEPFAFLDIISQQIVLRHLKDISKARKTQIGIIITSQQIYEIESVADRLLVLKDGASIFSGTITELGQKNGNRLIVEFGMDGLPAEIQSEIEKSPSLYQFVNSETSYIASFERSPASNDFNDVVETLGWLNSGSLHYVRNISTSSRTLFETSLSQSNQV